MTTSNCPVVFFDIVNTLADVRLSADGDGIAEIKAFPGVVDILQTLVQGGARLGIITDPAMLSATDLHAILERDGISSFFDDSLIFLGPNWSSRLFRKAAARTPEATGCASSTLLYVGEDMGARARAMAAGFRTVPHPALAPPLVRRPAPLRYLRIRLPAGWTGRLDRQAVVPFYVAPPAADGSGVVYAIADALTVPELDEQGFVVDRLGPVDGPQTSEAYFIPAVRQGDGDLEGVEALSMQGGSEVTAPYLLDATEEGLIIALPAGTYISSLRFQHAGHQHPAKLLPSLTLLQPAPAGSLAAGADSPPEPLRECEVKILTRRVTPDIMAEHVARYAGTGPESPGELILSRHIHHSHNARAVEALVDDLTDAGPGILRVERQLFRHDERDLVNVVATLPRATNETRIEIVLVSAHLDSIADEQPCYRPSIDAAPGADDDASGIAGVLAAARACVELAALGIAHREIRFVLFNAEEQGTVGSAVYATSCKEHHEPLMAVFHMDMIGHDLTPPPHFELHAGLIPVWFSSGTILQDSSRRLADLIAALRPAVSPGLPKPQIFKDRYDPGRGLSDHTRFHDQSYPACLASEDFFPSGTGHDKNPHYHGPTDLTINAGYAADIARVVAAAAWVMATR